MSFWMEIHCDVLTYGTHPNNILRHLCDTHSVSHPSAKAYNTCKSINRVKRILEREARQLGWVSFMEDGQRKWACPGCKNQLEKDK